MPLLGWNLTHQPRNFQFLKIIHITIHRTKQRYINKNNLGKVNIRPRETTGFLFSEIISKPPVIVVLEVCTGFKVPFSVSFKWVHPIDCLTDKEVFMKFLEEVLKNVPVGILLLTLAAWVVFERSGYTLLSLVSSVLLLLTAILFLWAKSAAILNRPAPPLPELYLSEEMVNELAAFICTRVNDLLSVSQDIALGRNSRLFFKVAACLSLVSSIGGLTDFLTLGYTSLVIILTLPALYEKYEDPTDKYAMMGYKKLQRLYSKIDEEFINKIRKWILEKK